MSSQPELIVYEKSNVTALLDGGVDITCFLARNPQSGERLLGVRAELDGTALPFSEQRFSVSGAQFFALNPGNAALLRGLLPWLVAQPLEPPDGSDSALQPSFGFGDRLGLATPGHIQALQAACPDGGLAPVFAQQSVRENARTGRTPQAVIDDALWGVFQEGWRLPWGADADHLKQVSDLPEFVQAGYTFFTIDPGEHVDPAADSDPPEDLRAKAAAQSWSQIGAAAPGPAAPDLSELVSRFQDFCSGAGLACEGQESLEVKTLRAVAKYGQAIIHVVKMFHALQALKPGGFDFEVSVDETETPTSVLEHFYIAGELKRLGVRFTSLAPRLPGRFEKGVDYIGDLEELDKELGAHAQVMRQVGGYKLSLHSGSDKFSVYPLLVRHAGAAVHVKTAGTSYLEALRVASVLDPQLFRQALELARQRYPIDRYSYHVSADEQRLPDPAALVESSLPALLEDFDAREALHVTFGSFLAQSGDELKAMLLEHPQAYEAGLLKHFRRHLEPLLVRRLDI